MKTIELSEEEITVTIQLIDIAIKSGGLNVAEAGAVLAKKLGSHLQQASPEQPKELADEVTDFEVVEDKD